MKIKGMDGMEHNVASSGVGNTALGFGIAGTALGLMNNNGCGNGLFGGLFGGNCNNNNCCNPVNQTELNYAIALAACQGREYALATARQEDASIFAESRRTDDKISGVVKDVTGAVLEIGNALSKVTERVACLQLEVNRNREEAARDLRESKEYTDCKVSAEAQLRKCGDDNIVAWTQAELNKKINGELVINGDDVMYSRCRPILEQCPCGTATNPYNVDVRIIAQQAAEAAVAALKK